MIKEDLSKRIKDRIESLVIEIADEHFEGKPAILVQGIYFNIEEFIVNKITKIEETFK